MSAHESNFDIDEDVRSDDARNVPAADTATQVRATGVPDPFQRRQDRIDEHLRESLRRVMSADPDQRRQLLENMDRWERMTPEQREEARQRFREQRQERRQEQKEQRRERKQERRDRLQEQRGRLGRG